MDTNNPMVQWCRRRVSTGGAPLVEEIEDDEPCFAGASTGLPPADAPESCLCLV